MNRHAYLATGHVIALMEALSKVNVNIHGRENIPPNGSLLFVVNHFTRIETLLLPYHIYHLTGRPVWSLANPNFFTGALGQLLEAVGAVSTLTPHRDRVIVKSLLTGEANWIIFPEGCMVKDKLIVEHARYTVSCAGGRRPPHTGAATLALRTEFYRQRLQRLSTGLPAEAERLKQLFGLEDLTPVLSGKTFIVPVNITYYPLRAKENALSRLADIFLSHLAERYHEELLTEGAMVLDGVDIDIRFGQPIEPGKSLAGGPIEQDIFSQKQIDFDDRLPSRQAMRLEAYRLMQRYMRAIYEQTTVNHDHLFASLLRCLPFKKFSEEDFRRRAFLLASSTALSGLYRHQSLESGQVALLTDDRHHQFGEFLSLALETGIIHREGVSFVKDSSKFSSPLDLNRARIDNPIGVIANEVLPLNVLQREVRLNAWLPSMFVGSFVHRRILRRSDQEFDTDYRTFFRTGESKARDVGRPYMIKGKSRKVGVVLVHGFLAAPREVSKLADFLGDQGLWVAVVRLKGHGTSPEDLALRSSDDWRESVDSAYAALIMICRKVALVGFSFGGGLALDCAARNRNVAGVVAVCPPMRLNDFSSYFAPSLEIWNRLMNAVHYQKGKREFVEISLEHPDINYHRLPVAGLTALEQFMSGLEEQLPKIRIPTLIIQSQGDPVVDPKASRLLFDLLGSSQKDFRMLDIARHGILLGEGSEKVYSVIGEYISKISQNS